jgi:hypothetical protein
LEKKIANFLDITKIDKETIRYRKKLSLGVFNLANLKFCDFFVKNCQFLETIIIGKFLEIRGLYSVNSIVSPKILTKKKLAKFLISQKCKEKEKEKEKNPDLDIG